MAGIDVFSGDAFNTFELTAALEATDYKPGFLGSLGIFEPVPVRTETVAVERRENTLSVVATSDRGAPLAQGSKGARTIRDFRTYRIAKGDRLNASEIQNIRAFGSDSELEQVQEEVMRRLIRVRDDVELTHEYHRLGALQGIVLDADGSPIINWYDEWGIAQPSEIDFDLDNANPASGALRKKCNQTIRAMAKASKGAWVDGMTQVYGLCGDNFYDDLVAHPEVRETYKGWAAAADLRPANPYEIFRFGSINWVNYRGTDDGSTVAVGTDKCHLFPVGARGVFQHAMSPGESFDWVNTPGQPFYALQVPDEKRNTFVDLEVYSYPLFICTRPGMLLRGKRT